MSEPLDPAVAAERERCRLIAGLPLTIRRGVVTAEHLQRAIADGTTYEDTAQTIPEDAPRWYSPKGY